MDFPDTLNSLGSPEALRANPRTLPRTCVNAHVHLPPNFLGL